MIPSSKIKGEELIHTFLKTGLSQSLKIKPRLFGAGEDVDVRWECVGSVEGSDAEKAEGVGAAVLLLRLMRTGVWRRVGWGVGKG